MIRALAAAAALLVGGGAAASEPAGLHDALVELEKTGQFSGAVVIRDARGVRFARAYGMADPFAGRPFTVDTPVDSGSLPKPITAAATLVLARRGKIDLDASAARYLPELAFPEITIRHLLAHSAGLRLVDSASALAGKSNLQLVAAANELGLLHAPGTKFVYCNLCTIALAVIIERVSGQHYLQFVRTELGLPADIGLRPQRLSDWQGRAIGYQRDAAGNIERADSFEGEAFYGPANLSVSARQIAEWGHRWLQLPRSIRARATAAAKINGHKSGLTLGNWYCSADRTRCHYLGHHEGFHNLLYWDSRRHMSVAMVSNNTLAPALQQRLQRALVAFAEGRAEAGRAELRKPLPRNGFRPGQYRGSKGAPIRVASNGTRMSVQRGGLDYPAYPVATGILYVPGLDAYLAGDEPGRLHWLSLYEEILAPRR